MKYHALYCQTCGYETEELIGVYQCPNCGNQMRFAKNTKESVKILKQWEVIILSILAIPILFVPFIGIILYPITVFLIWYGLRKHHRNNAIRLHSTQILNKSWVLYTCNTCGNSFQGQRGNCPHCGATLTYND